MFNPYLGSIQDALTQVEPQKPACPSKLPPKPEGPGILEGILGKLSSLDGDDLVFLLLLYLLTREDEEDRLWPLVAVGLYLLL